MLYLVFKRGDQPGGRAKNGSLVTRYDPAEWGHTLAQAERHFSQNMHQVFTVLRVPDNARQYFDRWWAPIGDLDRPTHKKTGVLNLNALQTLIGEPGLLDKLNSEQGVRGLSIDNQVINWSSLMKDADTFQNPATLDLLPFSSGTKTWGTAGDYSDLTSLEADIGYPATGQITARMISAVTETSRGTFVDDFGGNLLKIESASPHGGDITAGYLHTHTHDLQGIIFHMSGAETGDFEISGFKMTRTIDAASAIYGLIDARPRTGTAEHKIHDMFLDGNGKTGTGVYFYHTATSHFFELFNCAIRDVSSNGIHAALGQTNSEIENVLIEGCGNGLDANSNAILVENVGSVNNAADYINIASATGNNNIDSDATGEDADWSSGSNNISSVTPANEYELDDTLATYADATGSNSQTGGKAPSLSANDMDGDAWSGYPIGPKNAGGGGDSIPYLLNQRRRRMNSLRAA